MVYMVFVQGSPTPAAALGDDLAVGMLSDWTEFSV